MAKYRKLVRDFWVDPRVRTMNIEQKMFFAYAITGNEACINTNISGIYEVYRGSFEQILGIDGKDLNNIIDFFNNKLSDLLEYDVQSHMMYVKSFFKYNSHYKSNVSAIMDDFDLTFHKAPKFWAEFGEINRPKLSKIYPILEDEEQRKFLDRLFELENEFPNSQIEPKSKFKLKESSKENIK